MLIRKSIPNNICVDYPAGCENLNLLGGYFEKNQIHGFQDDSGPRRYSAGPGKSVENSTTEFVPNYQATRDVRVYSDKENKPKQLLLSRY